MTRETGRARDIFSAMMREFAREPAPPAGKPGEGIVIDMEPVTGTQDRADARPRRSAFERLMDLRDLASAAGEVSKRFVELHDDARDAATRLQGRGTALKDSVVDALPPEAARTLKEWQDRAADIAGKARAAMASPSPAAPLADEIDLFASVGQSLCIVTAGGSSLTLEAAGPEQVAAIALAILKPEGETDGARFLPVTLHVRLREPEEWPAAQAILGRGLLGAGAAVAVLPAGRPEADARGRAAVACLVDGQGAARDCLGFARDAWSEMVRDALDAGDCDLQVERVEIGGQVWPRPRAGD